MRVTSIDRHNRGPEGLQGWLIAVILPGDSSGFTGGESRRRDRGRDLSQRRTSPTYQYYRPRVRVKLRTKTFAKAEAEMARTTKVDENIVDRVLRVVKKRVCGEENVGVR